jgi:hypothetical protein
MRGYDFAPHGTALVNFVCPSFDASRTKLERHFCRRIGLLIFLVILLAQTVIGGQVTSPSFEIALYDRVAGKSSAAATFSFTTSAEGALAAGSNITLTYPSGFFSGAGSPSVQISGGGPTGSVATPTGTQIIITTAAQAIGGNTAVTVTVTGLTMGGTPTVGGDISVATSVDPTASAPFWSGSIEVPWCGN